MKSKRIVIVGMMGSGKTTLAREVAQRLRYELYECDEIFEKKHNISIKDYFEKFGENAFRLEENKILSEILKNDKIVVSTGGGAVLDENNRKLLFCGKTTSFFINTNPEIIYNRISQDCSRPLLLVQNPKDEIKKILNERLKYYKMADYSVENNDTAEKTVSEILKKVNL